MVTADFKKLMQTRWYELLLRFAFGGLITVIAGLIARKFGPVVGGLFLAFPAIFPSAATLVEKHEHQRKQRLGESGIIRGRMAAGADAIGAALGSLGLCAFAIVCWQLFARVRAPVTLAVATITWLAVALDAWRIRRAI